MRIAKYTFTAAVALVVFGAPSAFGEQSADRGKLVSRGEDGGVCYELDVKEASQWLTNLEAVENAGKYKEAFDIAAGSWPYCLAGNRDRIYNVIHRNYRKLGQEAEKAGRIKEAFDYFYYPWSHFYSNGMYRDHEKNYSFTDASRTKLAYMKANADDFAIVEEAIGYYFNAYDELDPQLVEQARAVARHGGDKWLVKEEEDFTARRYNAALDDLGNAERWFRITYDEQPIRDRQKLRHDSLIVQDSYAAIELSGGYSYDHGGASSAKTRARASELGDAAERRGDLKLAEKFYNLSQEDAKRDAVSQRMEAAQKQKEEQEEQAESERTSKFQEEQDELEKELGLFDE